MKYRIMALCDSPTQETGFGRVAQNLLKRWHGMGAEVEVWGIAESGWPHDLPYRIYPAGFGDWHTRQRMQFLLTHMVKEMEAGRPYTHLWMMQDTFLLVKNGFAKAVHELGKLHRSKGHAFKSLLYFPVDAPVDGDWVEIVEMVDVAVAYTEYGKESVKRWTQKQYVHVLPHGVDWKVYKPLDALMELPAWPECPVEKYNKLKHRIRQQVLAPNAARKWPGLEMGEGDVLLLNVNTHSRRKGLLQSLEVLKYLKALAGVSGIRYRLLMNMPEFNPEETTSLRSMGEQCGLEYGQDWMDTGAFFSAGGAPRLSQEDLRGLYSAADLVLTTTLGEGWGLSMTEGVACGTCVAVPRNTSCAEIANEMNNLLGRTAYVVMPLLAQGVVNAGDNSRVRRPVDVVAAAEVIHRFVHAERHVGVVRMTEPATKWLDWDRIAREWWRLFKC